MYGGQHVHGRRRLTDMSDIGERLRRQAGLVAGDEDERHGSASQYPGDVEVDTLAKIDVDDGDIWRSQAVNSPRDLSEAFSLAPGSSLPGQAVESAPNPASLVVPEAHGDDHGPARKHRTVP